MWGDAAQPESESTRGKRARRRKKTPTRNEKQLRFCAALHIVRMFLPGRGKVPHHVLGKYLKSGASTGSLTKCDGHPFSTLSYILTLKNLYKLPGKTFKRTLPIVSLS